MQAFGTRTPSGVYLLADHLDATLAVGEDLLAESLPPLADLPEGQDAAATLSGFVARLERHEQGLLLRLLQARRRAGELAGVDALLKPALGLFVANTAVLVDLVATFAAGSEARFDTGEDPHLFLRRRGLVDAEAAAASPYVALSVGDDYRIGGVIAAGPLLDMVAGVLDLLDSRFDLYPERDGEGEAVVPATLASSASADSIAPVATAGDGPGAAADNPDTAGTATRAPGVTVVAGPDADVGSASPSPETIAPAMTARSLAEALREIRDVT